MNKKQSLDMYMKGVIFGMSAVYESCLDVTREDILDVLTMIRLIGLIDDEDVEKYFKRITGKELI